MPLPPPWTALESSINTVISALMSQVGSKAEAFLASHGWYFQGIKIGTLPVNGALITPDKTGHPHYQTEDWTAYGITFPPQLPCTFEVNNYDGPRGKDWAAVFGVQLDGIVYLKTVAYNGNAATTTDWIAMEPPLFT